MGTPLYMCGVLDIRFRWYLANFWPKEQFCLYVRCPVGALPPQHAVLAQAVRTRAATPPRPPLPSAAALLPGFAYSGR